MFIEPHLNGEKRGWIEVCTVGPNESVDFRVDSHLVEQSQITQRPVEFARQHGAEINRLLCSVIKPYIQNVRTVDFDCANFVNRMTHASILTLKVQWVGAVVQLAHSIHGLTALNSPATFSMLGARFFSYGDKQLVR